MMVKVDTNVTRISALRTLHRTCNEISKSAVSHAGEGGSQSQSFNVPQKVEKQSPCKVQWALFPTQLLSRSSTEARNVVVGLCPRSSIDPQLSRTRDAPAGKSEPLPRSAALDAPVAPNNRRRFRRGGTKRISNVSGSRGHALLEPVPLLQNPPTPPPPPPTPLSLSLWLARSFSRHTAKKCSWFPR